MRGQKVLDRMAASITGVQSLSSTTISKPPLAHVKILSVVFVD
jgi:hypothetical protein